MDFLIPFYSFYWISGGILAAWGTVFLQELSEEPSEPQRFSQPAACCCLSYISCISNEKGTYFYIWLYLIIWFQVLYLSVQCISQEGIVSCSFHECNKRKVPSVTNSWHSVALKFTSSLRQQKLFFTLSPLPNSCLLKHWRPLQWWLWYKRWWNKSNHRPWFSWNPRAEKEKEWQLIFPWNYSPGGVQEPWRSGTEGHGQWAWCGWVGLGWAWGF